MVYSMTSWKPCLIIPSILDGQPRVWFDTIINPPRMQNGFWEPPAPPLPCILHSCLFPCERWQAAPMRPTDGGGRVSDCAAPRNQLPGDGLQTGWSVRPQAEAS